MLHAATEQIEAQFPLSDWAWPARHLGNAPAAGALALVLDEIDHGMVLLDGVAEVQHVNRAGRLELDHASGHPLQLVDGRLRARHAQDMGPLSDALSKASQRRLRALVTLGDKGDKTLVAVIPCGQKASLVVLGKRQLAQQISVECFARLYGLTSAETRVLEKLCDGQSPKQVAQLNRVTLATVRTQIVTIRAKTGADNICALIRQVAVLPPMMGALRC